MTKVRLVGMYDVIEWDILPDGSRVPGRVLHSACLACFLYKPHECAAPKREYVPAGTVD